MQNSTYFIVPICNYSVSAEYSVTYSAEYFGRNRFRSVSISVFMGPPHCPPSHSASLVRLSSLSSHLAHQWWGIDDDTAIQLRLRVSWLDPFPKWYAGWPSAKQKLKSQKIVKRWTKRHVAGCENRAWVFRDGPIGCLLAGWAVGRTMPHNFKDEQAFLTNIVLLFNQGHSKLWRFSTCLLIKLFRGLIRAYVGVSDLLRNGALWVACLRRNVA